MLSRMICRVTIKSSSLQLSCLFFNLLRMDKLGQMGKTWKVNTVVTFLARLADKGFLAIEKRGRNNIYKARFNEQDYLASQTRIFLKSMYRDDAKELVASLLRHECLTADDIEELAEFWRKGRDAT